MSRWSRKYCSGCDGTGLLSCLTADIRTVVLRFRNIVSEFVSANCLDESLKMAR
jgi:hypothetical protein